MFTPGFNLMVYLWLIEFTASLNVDRGTSFDFDLGFAYIGPKTQVPTQRKVSNSLVSVGIMAP